MRTLIFECECKITEKQFKEFEKNGFKMVKQDQPVAKAFGRDIILVRGYVKPTKES